MSSTIFSASGSSSGYRQFAQAFTADGTFTLPAGYGGGNPLTVEATVVGGGGGSGGNDSRSSVALFGGGGGGGGVRTGILSLTANTPVIVGRGGCMGGSQINPMCAHGGNGTFSAVGVTAAKNLWVNPQCLRQQSGVTWWPIDWSNNGGTFAQQNTGGSISGGQITWGNLNSILSRGYRLVTGATYTISAYFQAASTSQNVDITALFYTSSSKSVTPVSTSNLGASALTSGVYVRKSFTFTVPALVDMVQFKFTGSGTSANIAFSNVQLEAGGSATTYADGDTASYAWVGPRDGSETVATGTWVAVAGGGGGAGSGQVSQGTLAATLAMGGFPGATSGGSTSGAATTTSATIFHGGHGGGAGGNATDSEFFYQTSASSFTTGVGPVAAHAPFGMGGPGFASTKTISPAGSDQFRFATPGPGIGEWGKGGYGTTFLGTTGTLDPGTPTSALPGQGGSGTHAAAALSGTDLFGNNGADGLVILRYFA